LISPGVSCLFSSISPTDCGGEETGADVGVTVVIDGSTVGGSIAGLSRVGTTTGVEAAIGATNGSRLETACTGVAASIAMGAVVDAASGAVTEQDDMTGAIGSGAAGAQARFSVISTRILAGVSDTEVTGVSGCCGVVGLDSSSVDIIKGDVGAVCTCWGMPDPAIGGG